MTLDELNTTTVQQAEEWFLQTCGAQQWAKKMAEARPYSTIDALKKTALDTWALATTEDKLEAFSAHPMIGDLSTLRAKYVNTKELASNEQTATASASEQTLTLLQKLNHQYLAKHGFIFIICATGLSADTMLFELEKRLPNSTEKEIQLAAKQQIQITLLRLDKGLSEKDKS